MGYLLDANAVIALLNDKNSQLAQQARLCKPAEIFISPIVVQELFYGAFKSRRSEHNVSLIDHLRFEVLDFDKEDARVAGEVRADLAVKGTPIGPYDGVIAGQTKARDLILITHSTSEFERVPRLRVNDWQT
jgi:tRNA(fMet)-specific endonuclease VapC